MGKLIVISAPSGAGKTSIVHYLLSNMPELSFSVSACSREKRTNEIDGKDYRFLGVDGFKKKIEENAFVEWEEVYENRYYGTLKSEVERIWDKGKSVIFDVDVIGGINIKNQYPKIIKEVRGVGLLIGLQLFNDQTKFIQKLMDNKLLTIRAAENVIRILPPLTVKKQEIDLAIKIIKKVCKEYKI